MTLTSRLTAFFVAALALVMVAFSVTLYLLAHYYLDCQNQDRVEGALDTLAAAIDISEGYLEWEGHERRLTLGADDAPDQVRWTVRSEEGRLLAKSMNFHGDDLGAFASARWLVIDRTVRGNVAARLPSASTKEDAKKHTCLRLTAAVSLQSQDATLRNLIWALAGLLATTLIAAGIAGRWLCRRALTPVIAMASAARSMTAADLEVRLPATGTAGEIADLERAFNELLARLQEAFERQRRFTGDASHQLRTPLAAVLGQVEVALRRERSNTEYRDVLVRVLTHGQRLQQIIESLLFLARSDGETKLPDLQRVELADWLPMHLQHWHDHPRWPDIRLEAEPCRASVQPVLLGQLIDNLLDNACKYSDADSRILVRVNKQGEFVTLSVSDEGSGIAAEDMPHLFEPFFRSAEARRLGKAGIGLGLAIANRIALAFGGRLELDTSSPPGASFVLKLPAA